MTHAVTMAVALLPPHGTWTAWTFSGLGSEELDDHVEQALTEQP